MLAKNDSLHSRAALIHVYRNVHIEMDIKDLLNNYKDKCQSNFMVSRHLIQNHKYEPHGGAS